MVNMKSFYKKYLFCMVAFFILSKPIFADYQVLLDISPPEGNIACVSGILQAGMNLMPDSNPFHTPYMHISNVTIQNQHIVVYVPESIEIPNHGMVPTTSLTAYLTYTYTSTSGVIWEGVAGPLGLSHSYVDEPPYICNGVGSSITSF